MKLNAPNFENEIVRFERLEEAHREPIRESSATNAMWNWMPLISSGTSFDSYFNYCMCEMNKGDFVPFVLKRRVDDAFAGLAAYADVSSTHRRLRIGYLWHPAEMRGSAITAATLLALFERARACRFRRIEFQFSDDNTRAIRAVERFGAKNEGVQREYFRATNGEWVNAMTMSLLGEEIDAAIKLLKDRLLQLQDI